MVFVNGVFSEELSDVSALGGVEGLVAGHIGAMEGASLDQVRSLTCDRPGSTCVVLSIENVHRSIMQTNGGVRFIFQPPTHVGHEHPRRLPAANPMALAKRSSLWFTVSGCNLPSTYSLSAGDYLFSA